MSTDTTTTTADAASKTPFPGLPEPDSRAEMIGTIALVEQIADLAIRYARHLRAGLSADAHAEHAQQGTIPTWRTSDGTTASLAVAKGAIEVDDEAAMTKWFQANRPDALVEQVRPANRKALLAEVRLTEGVLCTPDGTVVPGLRYRPGGWIKSLSVTVPPEAKARLDSEAADMLGAMLGAMGEPVGTEDPA